MLYTATALLAATADLNRISLASWDWVVIGIFFAAMIWICWDVAKKKKETSGDYFLSGRSATWIAIGASIFASNIGTTHADYFHDDIPCTADMTAEQVNGDYEKETGSVIVQRFKGLNPMDTPGVLVKNHGPGAYYGQK